MAVKSCIAEFPQMKELKPREINCCSFQSASSAAHQEVATQLIYAPFTTRAANIKIVLMKKWFENDRSFLKLRKSFALKNV